MARLRPPPGGPQALYPVSPRSRRPYRSTGSSLGDRTSGRDVDCYRVGTRSARGVLSAGRRTKDGRRRPGPLVAALRCCRVSCGFSVTDCFGRTVTLDHSNWEKHRQRRPEAVPYHQYLPLVLEQPDRVVRAYRDGTYHFYRLGIGTGRFRHVFLKLIVEYYDDGRGKVKTWWFTPTIDVSGTPLR